MKKQKLIFGIDEVGRGTLAGPVVASCVVFKGDISGDGHMLPHFPDSKKISAKKRMEYYKIIKNNSFYAVSSVSALVIDQINIKKASEQAMVSAFLKLWQKINKHHKNIILNNEIEILIDGNDRPIFPKEVQANVTSIVKGDQIISQIGAASIVAKIIRDYLMQRYDKLYPEYHFAKNKAYGTKEHKEAIKIHGACPIHRLSFAPFSKK